ncbi:unnamed protein product [Agarophyton chilense]
MIPGLSHEAGGSPDSSQEAPEWWPIRANMLITGTPGVGKTTLSRQLAQELGMRHIEIGAFARERNLLGDHDPMLNAFYMDEGAVLDELEPLMVDGGIILDHHNCDWFPERWVQMVVCLRASTEALYDRLEARGYSYLKRSGNMQAEIMQVVLEEAVTSYPRVPVIELRNDTEAEKLRNINEVKRAWGPVMRRYRNPGDNSTEHPEGPEDTVH